MTDPSADLAARADDVIRAFPGRPVYQGIGFTTAGLDRIWEPTAG